MTQAQLVSELENEIPRLIERHLLEPTIRLASAANMPTGFIKGIKLKQDGKNYIIYNDWTGEKGEPLAEFFEYGTKRHYIAPKSRGDPAAKGAKSLHWMKDGLTFFSKGHYVSGITAYNVMKTGISNGFGDFLAATRAIGGEQNGN